MRINLFAFLILLALAFANVAAQSSTDLTLEKGVAPHPEIDNIYRRFSEAYRKLDAQAVKNLYTDDALYLTPGSEVERGHEKILANFSGFFDSVRKSGGKLAISFQILERRVSNDLGYDAGIYTLTQTNAKGETGTGGGKFVVITRRMKNGEWRFGLDIYNDLPRPRDRTN